MTVTFDGGIKKYSGLFDIALEGGFIKEASKGFYQTYDGSNKLRRSQIEELPGFFEDLINNSKFKEYVANTYKIGTGKLLKEDNNE